MRRDHLISVAGLLLVAGLFGLWAGLRAVPPDETAIIAAQAARYAEATGRPVTDCAARPSAVAGVRMVVICGEGTAAPWVAAVDDWGNPVDEAILDGVPET